MIRLLQWLACAPVVLMMSCGGDAGSITPTLDDGGPRDGSLTDGAASFDSGLNVDGATPPMGTDAGMGEDSRATIDLPDGSTTTAYPCALPASSATTLFAADHRSSIALAATNTRLLSVDDRTYNEVGTLWQLWEAQSERLIASGTGAFDGKMASDIFALEQMSGLSVRSAADGTEIGTIPFTITRSRDGQPLLGESWGVGSDGTYVWTASSTALRIFDRSGNMLVNRPGTYSRIRVSALSNQVLVIDGPAGVGAVENIDVTTGSTVVTPFSGTFKSWSSVGDRFYTLSGTNGVRVYEANGTLVTLIAWPTTPNVIGGYGDYVWADDMSTPLRLFRVEGAAAAEVAWPSITLNRGPFAASSRFVSTNSLTGAGGLHDMSTNPPTLVRDWPSGSTLTFVVSADHAYTATNGAIQSYALAGGRDTPVNCGPVIDVALSQSGRFAVSMGVGQILIGDLSNRSHVVTIPEPANSLGISSDGRRLLESSYQSARIYDTASGMLVQKLDDFSTGSAQTGVVTPILSADGKKAFATYCTPTTCDGVLLDIDARTAKHITVKPTPEYAALSPAGAFLALQDGSGTNIFHDGVLSGIASGTPVAWLDETRLVVQRTSSSGQSWTHTIVDNTGTDVATTPITSAVAPDANYALRNDTLLFAKLRGLYDLATGAAIEAPRMLQAANDDVVLYMSGNELDVSSY